MTTEEHLEKIVNVCQDLLNQGSGGPRSQAGWRSTIAAIETMQMMSTDDSWANSLVGAKAVEQIITTWPEELL